MNSKKYQIFVSSTYSDLANTRRGVMDCIQNMNQFPVGMEMFSADDDEQWQIIKEMIDQTDYYICIIGHRYGTLTKDGRSFTEREWDYAKEVGVPIMTFIRNRDAATTPSERDSDQDRISQLNAFIAKASTDKMVEFWLDVTDLQKKIVTALFKAFSRKPRSGWIRSESQDVAEQLSLLVGENRDLRSQVEILTSKANNALPDLRLLINTSEELKIDYMSDRMLGMPEKPTIAPIEWKDVVDELRPFITKKEIDEYNAAIPTQEKIDEIYWQICNSIRIKKTAESIIISVGNIGSAKARGVYVDLQFPKYIVIFEKSKLDEYIEPSYNMPKNPLKRAIAMLRRSREPYPGNNILDRIDAIKELTAGVSRPYIPDIARLTIASPGRSIKISENVVSIWIQDLMHTRENSFADLLAVPYQAGEFEAKATIICEEWTKQKELLIPIIVASKSMGIKEEDK